MPETDRSKWIDSMINRLRTNDEDTNIEEDEVMHSPKKKEKKKNKKNKKKKKAPPPPPMIDINDTQPYNTAKLDDLIMNLESPKKKLKKKNQKNNKNNKLKVTKKKKKTYKRPSPFLLSDSDDDDETLIDPPTYKQPSRYANRKQTYKHNQEDQYSDMSEEYYSPRYKKRMVSSARYNQRHFDDDSTMSKSSLDSFSPKAFRRSKNTHKGSRFQTEPLLRHTRNQYYSHPPSTDDTDQYAYPPTDNIEADSLGDDEAIGFITDLLRSSSDKTNIRTSKSLDGINKSNTTRSNQFSNTTKSFNQTNGKNGNHYPNPFNHSVERGVGTFADSLGPNDAKLGRYSFQRRSNTLPNPMNRTNHPFKPLPDSIQQVGQDLETAFLTFNTMYNVDKEEVAKTDPLVDPGEEADPIDDKDEDEQMKADLELLKRAGDSIRNAVKGFENVLGEGALGIKRNKAVNIDNDPILNELDDDEEDSLDEREEYMNYVYNSMRTTGLPPQHPFPRNHYHPKPPLHGTIDSLNVMSTIDFNNISPSHLIEKSSHHPIGQPLVQVTKEEIPQETLESVLLDLDEATRRDILSNGGFSGPEALERGKTLAEERANKKDNEEDNKEEGEKENKEGKKEEKEEEENNIEEKANHRSSSPITTPKSPSKKLHFPPNIAKPLKPEEMYYPFGSKLREGPEDEILFNEKLKEMGYPPHHPHHMQYPPHMYNPNQMHQYPMVPYNENNVPTPNYIVEVNHNANFGEVHAKLDSAISEVTRNLNLEVVNNDGEVDIRDNDEDENEEEEETNELEEKANALGLDDETHEKELNQWQPEEPEEDDEFFNESDDEEDEEINDNYYYQHKTPYHHDHRMRTFLENGYQPRYPYEGTIPVNNNMIIPQVIPQSYPQYNSIQNGPMEGRLYELWKISQDALPNEPSFLYQPPKASAYDGTSLESARRRLEIIREKEINNYHNEPIPTGFTPYINTNFDDRAQQNMHYPPHLPPNVPHPHQINQQFPQGNVRSSMERRNFLSEAKRLREMHMRN